jgi:hypothetical protein
MTNPFKGKKRKPRRLRAGQRPQWYKLEAFFDGKAQTVCDVNGEDVVLAGWIPPENEVAVCLAPTSITHDQGMALEKLLEANFRSPVVVLTNNIQLVKLKPVLDSVARKLIGAGEGDVVQFERGKKETPKVKAKKPPFTGPTF